MNFASLAAVCFLAALACLVVAQDPTAPGCASCVSDICNKMGPTFCCTLEDGFTFPECYKDGATDCEDEDEMKAALVNFCPPEA
ncbi:uncharacterized protein SCHCODRAFT_02638071 [Schizophyllum commune H4-8]|uniref:uncharacterized protein n=1 Tax=Schizophyllum commune (strain H4-8 / FGSC 9210) TaxID=578458 RepID=UPI00216014CE|nr:uncharacterized protein SCHCODRAFT_02638071 [Schizophyllum commune H4-8]KAI5887421.1 hypothetical protein SCHCODRAFT_02638071 [Schizophyllum commune H4-8]